MILGIFVTVAIEFPWLILAMVPLIVIFWFLGVYFRRTVRQLKRMESISRSPIVAHVQQSLYGLLSLRCFGQQQRFININNQLVDDSIRVSYPYWTLTRWFSMRLDIVSSFLVAGTSFMAIGMRNNPANSGLALTYALLVAAFFQWAIRNLIDTEAYMTSVERILHYANNVPMEAEAIIEHKRPPKEWPHEGAIKMDKVYVKYREDLPPVLKKISLEINKNEKIGVVGRTGAGKVIEHLLFFNSFNSQTDLKMERVP